METNSWFHKIPPCLSVNYYRLSLIFAKIFCDMNLHEYQAKELLKKYNVPVQEGFACGTVHEAEDAYRQIKNQSGSSFAVVKAQIHAGGRGKGTVKETGYNGVKVAKNLDLRRLLVELCLCLI